MVQFPIILLVIITGIPPSLKLLLLITSLLFLNQLMTAHGLPVVVQVNLEFSLDLTVLFPGGCIIVGTTILIELNRINPVMYSESASLC